MALSNVAGFPRIGPRRELKFATEAYWRGERSAEELAAVASGIRRDNRQLMREAGVDLIPVGDFSLYDQVLDITALVGAAPERFGRRPGAPVDLDTYFAMARGRQTKDLDVGAMEMSKWFDTNYHYIIPELWPQMSFCLATDKPFAEHAEVSGDGVGSAAVLLGPLSFVLLGKPASGVDERFNRLSLLPQLAAVYEQVLVKLGEQGCEWVQLDEPVLVRDTSLEELEGLDATYRRLGAVAPRPKICVKTYFGHLEEAYPHLARLPVEGIGVDFARAPQNEDLIAGYGKAPKTLFAGVVDGRNVWINDLEASLALLRRLDRFAEEIVVSTSCSLLHVPLDVDGERDLPGEVRSWLAFARQKVREVVLLTRALNEGDEAVSSELEDRRAALAARAASIRTQNPEVRRRLAALEPSDASRYAHYPDRRKRQRVHLGLSRFPTTTTGSFPQTPQIRKARARLQASEINLEAYQEEMKAEIERVVRFQEEAGLDVLVHGEAERNDMVQYFAEELEGFVLTKRGWVQSFGNRYVRPPIIVGDISRPAPMTLEWITHAQSLTEQPMKGMLTGPVTMLMWSFVRDDQPRSVTCKQLALAVREEVADLEKAGIRVIQVDEPALREGLPLRRAGWGEYVAWAAYCFRLATSCVADDTQIQTHMCYSAFADVIDAIDALDADVLLIEHSRSSADLLEDFRRSGYEREIGVGVYDVHSPRVPSVEEMARKLQEAAEILAVDQIWVVPDCGLKTRTWEEVRASLKNMVGAAKLARRNLDPGP